MFSGLEVPPSSISLIVLIKLIVKSVEVYKQKGCSAMLVSHVANTALRLDFLLG
jgi:hypothetical protein